MKPVFQDRFMDDPRGGNCVAACLASLLEIPLSEVPDFDMRRNCESEDGEDWRLFFGAWLEERFGLTLVSVDIPREDDDQELCGWWAEVEMMLGGPGPRGVGHCVVARGDQIVHDPRPEGGGLLKVKSAYFLLPARVRSHRASP